MDRKKGFTLVELLVVIAILAVLLTLITPVLKRSRLQAQRVYCELNCKSQYLAQVFYSEDNEGKFAPHDNISPEWYKDYGREPSLYTAIKDYVEDSAIMLCPIQASQFGFGVFVPYANLTLRAGWDFDRVTNSSPDDALVINGYMWFANYNYRGLYPTFVFDTYFLGKNLSVHEPPWPRMISECNSEKAFIAHPICRFLDGTATVYDLSHGGSWAESRVDFEAFSTSEETPLAYADGHVENSPKFEMGPRAITGASQLWFY